MHSTVGISAVHGGEDVKKIPKNHSYNRTYLLG